MKNPVEVNRHQMFLECSCGCGVLDVDYWEDGDVVALSYMIPSFYALQVPNKFIRALGIIWNIIRGKEHWFFEITLDTKSKVEEFKKFIADIDTSKLIFDE